MAETSWPFGSGPGSASGEDRWAKMAPLWAPDGVLPTSPTVALGSGLTFVIPAEFEAWVRGFFYRNDSAKSVTAATNTNSLPRIDRLVLRLDMAAKTVTAAVKQGTPAASPSGPFLTQNDNVWEYPLAYATAPGSASPQNYSGFNLEYEMTGRPPDHVRNPRVTGTLTRSDNLLKLNPGVITDLKVASPVATGAPWVTNAGGRGISLARSGWYRVETTLATSYTGARYVDPQLVITPAQPGLMTLLADTMSVSGWGSGGGSVDVYVPPHQTFQVLWNAYSGAPTEVDIRPTTRFSVTWLGYQLCG